MMLIALLIDLINRYLIYMNRVEGVAQIGRILVIKLSDRRTGQNTVFELGEKVVVCAHR